MNTIHSKFCRIAVVTALFLRSISCFADYLIPLHYWRKTAHGTEDYTVIIALDDSYGRQFGEPLELEPYLLKGKPSSDHFAQSLELSVQKAYLNGVREHEDIYGPHADAVADSVQQPGEMLKAPNSGVYVFSKGKLVLSWRVAAPGAGQDLPVLRTYRQDHDDDTAIPKSKEGLAWRKVAGTPEILKNGVWDVAQAQPERTVQVYQSGNIEVKALYAPQPGALTKIFPEVFALTRWMLEYSGERVPPGVRFADGTQPAKNEGALTSNIFCDCYTDQLRDLYQLLGFHVWSSERKHGLPHYFMVATPESLSAGTAEFRARFAGKPGAALAKLDEGLLEKIKKPSVKKGGKTGGCSGPLAALGFST